MCAGLHDRPTLRLFFGVIEISALSTDKSPKKRHSRLHEKCKLKKNALTIKMLSSGLVKIFLKSELGQLGGGGGGNDREHGSSQTFLENKDSKK